MNDLNKTLLLCTCVLVFTTMLFFFKFAAERAKSADLLAQKEAAYVDARKSIKRADAQNEKASDAQKNAQIAEKKAQENFTKASEVSAELERLEAASAIEQIENAAQAKARIEREILARLQAEKNLEIISVRNESLEKDLLMLSSELERISTQNAQKIRNLQAENLRLTSSLKKELDEAKLEIRKLKENIGSLGGENKILKAVIVEKDNQIKLSIQKSSKSEPLIMKKKAEQ